MKRSYASTQVNLPSFEAASIRTLGQNIAKRDLAEEGRETDPHITVKYGLHTNDPGKVRRVLANEPPVEVTLGATSFFPGSESGNGDVVKVDVDSADLRRLHKKLSGALAHTDTHPGYKPHATVAYVKTGKGKKYAGDTTLAGRTVTIKQVMFCRKNGSQIAIPLTGKKERDG